MDSRLSFAGEETGKAGAAAPAAVVAVSTAGAAGVAEAAPSGVAAKLGLSGPWDACTHTHTHRNAHRCRRSAGVHRHKMGIRELEAWADSRRLQHVSVGRGGCCVSTASAHIHSYTCSLPTCRSSWSRCVYESPPCTRTPDTCDARYASLLTTVTPTCRLSHDCAIPDATHAS